MPVESLSGFLARAICAEGGVISTFKEAVGKYEQQLGQIREIKNLRIIKNHAQLMALVDCLSLVIPVDADMLEAARDELADMAISRQEAINADHPDVQAFWEVFDYLNGDDDQPRLNHSCDPALIAINLNQYVQYAAEKKQQIPLLAELKKLLKNSRTRKFVEAKAVNSLINREYNKNRDFNHPARPETVYCWIFEA
jgi:hypothetical protein